MVVSYFLVLISCGTTKVPVAGLRCPAPQAGISEELKAVCQVEDEPLAKCPKIEEWLSRLVSYCESIK